MSSSSSTRRSFYDPKQPKLLSSEEIATLSPAECDVACLQIDQIIVSVLQNIDADFGRSHRTITEKILPELEQYGESSRGIWEGLKFWKGFFEASANVKLSGSTAGSETASPGSMHDEQDQSQTIQQSNIASHDSHPDLLDSRPPLEDLKESFLQNLGIPAISSKIPAHSKTVHVSDDSHQSTSTASLRQPTHWHDLSLDSPDVTLQAPSAKEISSLISPSANKSLASGVSVSLDEHSIEDVDNQTYDDESIAGPTHKVPSRNGPMLLHQAITKTMMDASHKRRTISTPAKSPSRRRVGGLTLPPEAADPKWNGLADLRKAPLGSFASPDKNTQPRRSKARAEPGEFPNTLSPSHQIEFSVPKSKLAHTPAKEVARLMARDVLETARFRAGYDFSTSIEDSPPLEPPSVLREWKSRGYESLFGKETGAQSIEVEQRVPEKPILLSSHQMQPRAISAGPSRDVSKSLIDLRDAELSSMKPSKSSHDPFSQERVGESRDQRPSRSIRFNHPNQIDDDDQMDSPPGSPTLFGIPNDPKKRTAKPESSSSFIGSSSANLNQPVIEPVERSFVPLKPDEMDTFFGGNLLESECFEPSPLQGKRTRTSKPK